MLEFGNMWQIYIIQLSILATPKPNYYPIPYPKTTPLGASHSKSFEFLLVLLNQCGGTNFKALTIFHSPKIGHFSFVKLHYFMSCCRSFYQVSVGTSWAGSTICEALGYLGSEAPSPAAKPPPPIEINFSVLVSVFLIVANFL